MALSALVFFPFLKHESHSCVKLSPMVLYSFKLLSLWSRVHCSQALIKMSSCQRAVLAHISNQYSGDSGRRIRSWRTACDICKILFQRKNFREAFSYHSIGNRTPSFSHLLSPYCAFCLSTINKQKSYAFNVYNLRNLQTLVAPSTQSR